MDFYLDKDKIYAFQVIEVEFNLGISILVILKQ